MTFAGKVASSQPKGWWIGSRVRYMAVFFCMYLRKLDFELLVAHPPCVAMWDHQVHDVRIVMATSMR